MITKEVKDYRQVLNPNYINILNELIFSEYPEKTVETYLIDRDGCIATVALINLKINELQNIIDYLNIMKDFTHAIIDNKKSIKLLMDLKLLINKHFVFIYEDEEGDEDEYED